MLVTSLAEGIKLAEADGVEWVFHVDTDELMYPASAAEYSLQVRTAVRTRCDAVGKEYTLVGVGRISAR